MGKGNKLGYMTTGRERASYWSYFVGQNFFYALVNTFLATYMLMIGVDLTKTASIMLLVKVWDAVNDALFGLVFDRVRFKSGNKSLPWLRISVAFIPIATVLLFVIPQSAGEVLKLAWFAIAYILWDTAYTFCDVPIYSMVTTMTDNLDERNKLMSFGRVFSGVGGAAAIVLCTVLVSEKVGVGFGVVAIILAVLGIAFMLPICIVGRERNHSIEGEESFTLREMLRYLRKNKYLLLIYSGQMISGALNTGAALGMFVSYYLFGSAMFNLLLGVLSAAPALIIALFIPKILRRFDKFKFYIACNVVSIALGFVLYFVGYHNVTAFLILSVIRSIPASAIGVMSFMFTPDCAEYGQYKSGTDARGITFAIQTFTSKITAAISSSLGMFVLGIFGWISVQANDFAELERLGITQPPAAIHGLWIAYILIPVIGLLVAMIPYCFYKLTDKDVQVMAEYNAGKITREEADGMLSRNY